MHDALPLHVGDRVLLRDPGRAGLAIIGATVLDVAPPALTRRGAAAAAGRELAAWPDPPSAGDLLRRHDFLRAGALAAMGVRGTSAPVTVGDWLADPDRWAALRRQLADAVAAHVKRDPLAIGMPVDAARAALGLADRALVEALARDHVQLRDGYLRPAGPPEAGPAAPSLPPRVATAVRAVLADLATAPFLAPDATRLRELGLDQKAIAAAARAGLLLRVSEQVVLAPGAQARAAEVLAGLPQPFTTAEARQALGTTRRVAIPLLEYLDRAGVTQRLPDDRRRLRLGTGVLSGARRRGSPAGYLTPWSSRGPCGSARGIRWSAGRHGTRRSSARRVGAFQPGVGEEALTSASRSQPAACERQDLDAAWYGGRRAGCRHRPPAVPGQPCLVRISLDVAGHLRAEYGGQPTAVDPHRPPHRQSLERRPAGSGRSSTRAR